MMRKNGIIWIIVILLTLIIRWVSAKPDIVDQYYSNGIYPVLAKFYRLLFGWIPFSVGDILYTMLIVWLIWKLVVFIKMLAGKDRNSIKWKMIPGRLVLFFLTVYVLFYGSWGLNYMRNGVVKDFKLNVKPYSVKELDSFLNIILINLNASAEEININNRDSIKYIGYLRKNIEYNYNKISLSVPQIKYEMPSLKKSVFGWLGNYAGISGYLNPFTGEAQINARIPLFYQPAVASHEVAHQLGYSSETEANFIGFLSAFDSPNPAFRYAAYYDIFMYGIREMYRRDSLRAGEIWIRVHPRVQKDRAEFREYLRKYRSILSPLVSGVYDSYLKANEQQSGINSYEEVVGLLIAWYRKQ